MICDSPSPHPPYSETIERFAQSFDRLSHAVLHVAQMTGRELSGQLCKDAIVQGVVRRLRSKGCHLGIDKLSGQGRGEPRAADRSAGGRRRDPNAIGIGSEEAKGGSADQVA